ncbi:MAG: adenosylcobalamin-dependent ribonucleoside-diphosphate reductase [Candidatus Omnitrophica bacterium]|nr:adenosylcobalamin-dependent ribonucleoside-diphosphate reductase [Candidatus Omnitrophota bacterium]
MIKNFKKRDGSTVKFNQDKITNAIYRATIAIGKQDRVLSKRLSDKVIFLLEKRFKVDTVWIENVQDMVLEVLKEYPKLCIAYATYRRRRQELRKIKGFIGIKDELKLEPNSLKVLKERYLLRDDKGEIIETPSVLFRRIARAISEVDLNYSDKGRVKRQEEIFYNMMANLEFLPNSPTLMNAGTPLGQLSACFILPVGDSLPEIFDTLKATALIQQSGGGTGYNFSNLRPKGDIVGSTHGVASGPISFISLFDKTTDVIKQGGKRRGANMGILDVSHPDIVEFIKAKENEDFLSNFNLSVAVTDEFMDAVLKNTSYFLVNPRTKKKVARPKARYIFDLIAKYSHRTGDPGVIFIDEINRHNVTPILGRMHATNPCGEVPALYYESCNLGSINLSRVVENKKLNWEKLEFLVKEGVHFLDNVIDANRYPLAQIEQITKANRKIGLGVMGFAEMLIKLGIQYNSKEALRFSSMLMNFIQRKSRETSIWLARERGSFANFKNSIWKKRYTCLRNATITTIAPTGTISIIANCSSGIEPLFAVAYMREMFEGTKLIEINSVFEDMLKRYNLYSKGIISEVAKLGSIQKLKLPAYLKRLFVTALDIAPSWHIRIQAAFQRHVDNAVSKTINLPKDSKVCDVKKAILLAYKLKCKGITIYRYGSKKEQVLYLDVPKRFVKADSEYSGGCPTKTCIF